MAQALFLAPSPASPAGTWSWDSGSWDMTLPSDVNYLPSVLTYQLENFSTQNPALGPLLSLFPRFPQQSSLPAAFVAPWGKEQGNFAHFHWNRTEMANNEGTRRGRMPVPVAATGCHSHVSPPPPPRTPEHTPNPGLWGSRGTGVCAFIPQPLPPVSLSLLMDAPLGNC